jgi:putative membrane-bound dehydrogenase-like protein
MLRKNSRLMFLAFLGCFGSFVRCALPAEDYHLHSALEMALFVKEPDVVDPVALTWDDEGSLYVVEMRDYPYGFGKERKPGGTVRLLKDSDGDGKVDRVTLFASDLSFPTSVAPWNGGIIVAAPPEIIFLKDTNGDGKADVREVKFKGFVLGVTDSNMNGLRWGLDNRLHGVNGGNGGSITSPRKAGTAVSIHNLDFSFDPKSGDFAPTYHTSGGFGLVFDDWGRSFVTYNINHMQQRMIPVRYLNRFPGLPPLQALENISDHGEMSRIYPISEPETRVNHPEQSGHFSSAGGMGFIGFSGYPGDLPGSVLVCDVVGNLVHRDVLSARGPGFIASRSPLETNSEFFASRELAFRPVGIELGPDGALYLIDMQRDVIEHPDYIPEPVRQKLNLRAGEDRGRIYRITPEGGLAPRKANLRGAASGELVAHLGDANSWWRRTAQRVLVERQDKSAVPALKALADGSSPLGRLHALWALQGMGALDEALIVRALSDAQAGIRENALVLAERHLSNSKQLQERARSLAFDSDARVRFQAALTLGEFSHRDAEFTLTTILARDYPYRWTRIAALSSLRGGEEKVFSALLNDKLDREGEGKLALIRELADLIAARARTVGSPELSAVFRLLPAFPPKGQLAALEGLQTGLARSGAKVSPTSPAAVALARLSATNSSALLAAAWKVSRTLGLPANDAQRRALGLAIKRALDSSRPPVARVENVRLLGLGDYAAVGQALFTLLERPEPSEVQLAAVDVLREFDDVDVARKLLDRWRALAPSVRSPVINLLLQRISFHAVLIDALETGRLTLGELNLDLEQRRRLLRESTKELRARAAKLMGDGEYANRKTVVEDWLKRLPAAGDATRGRAAFEKACAQCHALDGVGHQVGPDLAALAHRSVEDLLSNILDPNMAINPNYAAYTVETATGEIESGILQSESPEAIELLQAEARKIVVPRKQIKRLESSGVSLMPEGLEAGLTPAELRDLITFLQLKR